MTTWNLIFLVAVVAFHYADGGAKTICYFTDYSTIRPGLGKFNSSYIDLTMCTYIIYGYASLRGTTLITSIYTDKEGKMYKEVVGLKKKKPNLKVLLSIGGKYTQNGDLAWLARSKHNRNAFVTNAIAYLKKYGFDGLDIDWILDRTKRTNKQRYWELFVEIHYGFLREAKASGKPKLLLAGSFPSDKRTLDSSRGLIQSLSSFVDIVKVVTYDFWDRSRTLTELYSPLYSDPRETGYRKSMSVDWAIRWYLALGAPSSKLFLTIPLYSQTYHLVEFGRTAIRDPIFGPGPRGFYTKSLGLLAYFELCDEYPAGYKIVDVPSQRSKYLYTYRIWISYEDKQSIREKACYAKEHALGGIVFWSPDMDDFTGKFCENGKYPLMTAAIQELKTQNLMNCIAPTVVTERPPFIRVPCAFKEKGYEVFFGDCTKYYQCYKRKAYVSECQIGLVFNPRLLTCDYLRYVPECKGTSPY